MRALITEKFTDPDGKVYEKDTMVDALVARLAVNAGKARRMTPGEKRQVMNQAARRLMLEGGKFTAKKED